MTTEISWCKLTESGVLRFEGADALTFLQGQLTHNVAALDDVHSQYSGYCTPKGRLLAVLLLWRQANAFYMMLPRELCAPIRKRLSMYILRAKVTAQDVSAAHTLFGLNGAGAAAQAATLLSNAPTAIHGVAHGAGMTLLKLPRERYLIVAEPAAAANVEALLAQATPVLPASLWTALDIDAGIPNVVAATQEAFVPQMVNFDLINALSFDKGCYPGQEIVARTRYLGKIKQRMRRARLMTNDTPLPGDKLFSATFGEQASGIVVSAARVASGEHIVLAVVHVADATATPVHWKSPTGAPLQFEPLPYPAA